MSRSGSARGCRAQVVQLDDGDELQAALETAASRAQVVGVAGGDGSVTAAAQIALARSTPLLALPGGTLNHLARDLRVRDVDEAIDAVAAGEVVGVDVAAIGGRPFLNSAGFGAYPEMLVEDERLRRRLGRWPGRLAAWIKTMAGARPARAHAQRHTQAGLGRVRRQLPLRAGRDRAELAAAAGRPAALTSGSRSRTCGSRARGSSWPR